MLADCGQIKAEISVVDCERVMMSDTMKGQKIANVTATCMVTHTARNFRDY